jgi:putative spermidine/putrescine transport system substrate-binding protein
MKKNGRRCQSVGFGAIFREEDMMGIKQALQLRMRLSQLLSAALALFLMLSLLACSAAAPATSSGTQEEVDLTDFASVKEAAEGTTVNLYSRGTDERMNRWFDTAVADYLKENYGITLNRVPVDDTQLIIAKLLEEKEGNVSAGAVDVLRVNGENFYTAKNNNLFYGDYAQYLPNYQNYVDARSEFLNTDFGIPVDGLEVPFSKAIFVFINDSAKTPETPGSAQELMDYVKKYPGQVTYPAPPDFIGSVFVRQIAYDIVGYDAIYAAGDDKEKLREVVKPVMDYLNELKPYLWNDGTTYPSSSGQLKSMYSDGEVLLYMSYNPNEVSGLITDGVATETSRDFIFKKGMIGNSSYLAIPINATNKAAAMAFVDAMLSPELQASKLDAENWGEGSILDMSKLSEQDQTFFDGISATKGGVLSYQELEPYFLPELPGNVVPLLEEIWLEEVASK